MNLSPPPFFFSSSYESSGYDLTPSQARKVYISPFNNDRAAAGLPAATGGASARHLNQSFTQQQQSYFSSDARSGDESAIESGPSFNESLQRFRTATSNSDGGGASSPSLPQQQQSAYKMFTSSNTTSNSRAAKTSTNVTRSVEEQRTMITRNSQKSYHIE